ncbi:uncharacterized mitochondrial protein-like protein [Tanacetum coccineum]
MYNACALAVKVFNPLPKPMSRFLALGWLLEEIHVTWAHLKKKRTRLQTYTKSLEDFCKQWLRRVAGGIKRRRRDLSSDGVRNLATASGRGRLKEDLESSTWRRLIMEYLVKISKKAHILELKRRHLNITVLTSNTPKLLKTLSLDESRSPEFNLFSDLEEYSEEEVVETMAETMEQYMSKTRVDYGSRIARPKIDDKDSFELKGQFLKELRDNTFCTFLMSLTGAIRHWLRNKPSGSITTWEDLKIKFLSKYCPHARTAKKMEEINNFQQEPDETLYQAWIRRTETSDGLAAIQAQLNNLGREIKKVNEKVYASQVGCEQCKGPHYTKDCPLNEEGKTLKESYYTQFGGPFQGGGYRAAVLGFYQRNNANPSYQERRQSMEETLSKFMSESTKRHEENIIMIKEIRDLTNAAVRNQGASIKTLEIQIG